MAQVGDRVVVESEKVGMEPREGMVTATDGSLMRVRWDSGEETSFVPGAGSLQVIPRGRATPGSS